MNGNASEVTERRIALVIGNKDYIEASVLKNSVNDTTAISLAFKELGFTVTTVTNADYKTLLTSINQFTKDLRPTDVVVFYYSGHGISYNGKNYIIPTDARVECLEEIEANGIATDKFMLAFEAKKVRNSLIFLDACRNLPDVQLCNTADKAFGIPKGLSRPNNNPSGSMIAFATKEGKTADDNPSDNYSLFTNELLKYITTPNVGLRQILDLTKKGVEQRSKGVQSPTRYDKLSDDFYFAVSKEHPYNNRVVSRGKYSPDDWDFGVPYCFVSVHRQTCFYIFTFFPFFGGFALAIDLKKNIAQILKGLNP